MRSVTASSNSRCTTKEIHEALGNLHPVERMGEISEIAQTVLYLDSAKYVSGEILHVAEHGSLKPVSLNPRKNEALVFLRGLRFVWCRYQANGSSQRG